MIVTRKQYLYTLIGLSVLCAVAFAFVSFPSSFGALSQDVPGIEARQRTYNFFTATTTTATSTNVIASTGSFGEVDNGWLYTAGAEKVTFYFSRGDTTGTGNSGSTNFRIQVSPDATSTQSTNWVYYNKLVPNQSTSTVKTTFPSVTLPAGTSTAIFSMEMEFDAFKAVRCIAVEATDGEHTCIAVVEY